MVFPTSSSSLRRGGNPRAAAAVLVGLLSLASIPVGIGLSRFGHRVTLLQGMYGGVPAGFVLGLYSILLARRGRETIQRTLGRAGGHAAARAGKLLGVAGVCAALTGAMALGFYGLLTYFAS
jgi:hypothetical protein